MKIIASKPLSIELLDC